MFSELECIKNTLTMRTRRNLSFLTYGSLNQVCSASWILIMCYFLQETDEEKSVFFGDSVCYVDSQLVPC